MCRLEAKQASQKGSSFMLRSLKEMAHLVRVLTWDICRASIGSRAGRRMSHRFLAQGWSQPAKSLSPAKPRTSPSLLDGVEEERHVGPAFSFCPHLGFQLPLSPEL